MKVEEQCRSEGRKIHSQSQLASPGLWDTVKETGTCVMVGVRLKSAAAAVVGGH